jgi:hypothetical protein
MRKKIINQSQQKIVPPDQNWLNIEELAAVEITSEDKAHTIESALLTGNSSGWRAADPGKQTVRLIFNNPLGIQWIRLNFEEPDIERTQEYVLRWSPDGGQSYQEIIRQQWNFSPQGATSETEDYEVKLSDVTVLELIINPDISGKNAFASLKKLRLA